MLDYQRIVDDVRSSLYSHSAEGMDFLRAAAADYSVACDEVNERLRQCGTLLRKGLRSEAIQLGEIDPNALDVVAILDFPERDQWIELSQRNGLAPPTPLMLEVAAELNEAYAIEQPLAALLQRHRLLALAHGPLAARIQVLRRLADLDANSVWHEDLRTFEQERQTQLQAEVEAAARAGNTAVLASLDAELSSAEWKNPPPPALAKAAADAKTTLNYWTTQSQLEELGGELTSAMSGGRLDLGQTLYTRWNDAIADTGWQPHEQLAASVAPALAWARNHLDHQDALKALSRAIAGERSGERLHELYDRATKLGPLSAGLEERYHAKFAALERAARYRLWATIGGAVAAVAVVIVLIGWIVNHGRYEQQVAAAEKDVPFFVERGELERAEAILRDLPESAKNDARLQQARAVVEEKRGREHQRQEEFTQSVKDASYWLEQVEQSLTPEPNQTVLEHSWENFERIESDLATARKRARTEEERKQIAAKEVQAAHDKESLRRQLDKAFNIRYAQFDKELTRIERNTHASRPEQQTLVDDYKTKLQRWKADSSHVAATAMNRIGALEDRVSALEKGLAQEERAEQDEKPITAAVGDIPGYVAALREYVQRNPESRRSPDFKNAAEESLCWQAMAEWQKLAVPSRRADGAGLRALATKDQLELAKTVAKNFGDCPECASLHNLLPYLEAIGQRDSEGERIETALKKLFGDPLVANAWMAEVAEGAGGDVQRYYFRERPSLDGNSPALATFTYVAGFDGKTKDGWLKEGSKVQHVGRAPQSLAADRVQPILKALNDDNWEKSFCKMIAVLNENKTIDPILKANLLQQVLDTGIRGSHSLETAFAGHLEWIKEAKINAFANWLDPANSAAAVERKNAAEKLNNFPDVAASIKAAANDLKTKRQLAEFRWIGWLHRDRDGRWDCVINSAPQDAGLLFVVCRQATAEKLVLKAIGRFGPKAAVVDATAGSFLVEGRPVYLRIL